MRRAPDREATPGSFAISVVAHVVLGALLLWVLSIPAPLQQWLTRHRASVPEGERVSFFKTPGSGKPAAAHSGGNGRPQRGVPESPVNLVAPTSIPTPLPVTKPGAPKVEEEGTGKMVMVGGAGPGIEPEMHDPRIWVPPGAVIFAKPADNAGIFDTNVMRAALSHLKDSLAKKQADALSTVFTAGGKKYGVDDKNIYIADFKIPAALLALLPIHPTGYATPEQAYQGRQSAEINYNAGRALDAEDFNTAIKRIRQRKEREHEIKLAAEGKGPAPAPELHDRTAKKPVHTDPIALKAP